MRKRPDHGNGLRPWIPKQRPEFHLCATESHPLTWTSPCEDWSLMSLKEKLIKIGGRSSAMVAMLSSRWPRLPSPRICSQISYGYRRTAAATSYINRVKRSFVMGRVKLTGGLCLNDGKMSPRAIGRRSDANNTAKAARAGECAASNWSERGNDLAELQLNDRSKAARCRSQQGARGVCGPADKEALSLALP